MSDGTLLAGLNPAPPFTAFPKIPRLSRDCLVTEKIDGTNGQVVVSEEGRVVAVGSRNRYITPEQDNYGFAAWVAAHAEELAELGPGRHFGEWWGPGIQRGYGLKERRFSLFNVARHADTAPACCSVVPVLWKGNFDDFNAAEILAKLEAQGSVASPGFMRPEGIVVFHQGAMFKKLLENDSQPKGVAQN